ncbi:putative transposase [Streptomyces griseus subsp. griseus NBRC 13350]|uniref:Transposase n=1 Tax=Streptomyces griseus subsp. griseus (strain JCM 4626 / CBS 651.72 / NBRC 13350 / KCC S-0626 / ISP 5235) TaxID=455632 RepID=B1VLZ2_STRGG|nr:putative transposase [Streptomyces griseus subsp. griseus NBRC 13350]BAG23902.1 putative transposase [Streptomyces griseus subsp. griseus NBRC 13350]SEE21410.1 Transposase DDE domain-containing protein [Streptomyces griseus]
MILCLMTCGNASPRCCRPGRRGVIGTPGGCRRTPPRSPRRDVPNGTGPGKTRWVVERTFAWLHQFKRLRIRYGIRADLHLGLLQLARSIICLRRLRTSF